jgi:hypothetical protein
MSNQQEIKLRQRKVTAIQVYCYLSRLIAVAWIVGGLYLLDILFSRVSEGHDLGLEVTFLLIPVWGFFYFVILGDKLWSYHVTLWNDLRRFKEQNSLG